MPDSDASDVTVVESMSVVAWLLLIVLVLAIGQFLLLLLVVSRLP